MVERVGHEVLEDLLEPHRVRFDLGQALGQIQHDPHVRLRRQRSAAAGDPQGRLAEASASELQPGGPAVIQEVLHQVGEAPDLGAEQVLELVLLVGGADAGIEGVERRRQAEERGPDLVGHARDQRAHGGQGLPPAQLRLEAEPLGDVADGRDPHLLAAEGQAPGAGFDRHGRAVLPQRAMLVGGGVARADRGGDARAVLGGHAVHHGLADHLRQRIAEHAGELVVHVEHDAVLRERHALEGGLGDAPPALLALPQGLLVAPMLGDVAGDPDHPVVAHRRDGGREPGARAADGKVVLEAHGLPRFEAALDLRQERVGVLGRKHVVERPAEQLRRRAVQ